MNIFLINILNLPNYFLILICQAESPIKFALQNFHDL